MPRDAEPRDAAKEPDFDPSGALWLAYEFQSFRERARAELEALVKWAGENRSSSHEFISSAWADQVSMWAQSHLARLDKYEEGLNA